MLYNGIKYERGGGGIGFRSALGGGGIGFRSALGGGGIGFRSALGGGGIGFRSALVSFFCSFEFCESFFSLIFFTSCVRSFFTLHNILTDTPIYSDVL